MKKHVCLWLGLICILQMVCIFCMEPIHGMAAGNLLNNWGFESVSGSKPLNWSTSFPQNVYANQNTAYVYAGQVSLCLTNSTSAHPFASQAISGIQEGAEYAWGMRVRTTEANTAVAFKFEWRGASAIPSGGTPHFNENTGGEWREFSGTIKAPEGATSVLVLIRMYGKGTAYVDNLSFQYAKDPEKVLSFSTDDVFYYTDHTADCEARISLNTKFHHLENTDVKMDFLEGDTVLHSKTGRADANGKAVFTFPFSWIEKAETKYTVRCTLADNVTTCTQNVYKYPRPKFIRQDGVYEENGKVFNPVIMYHVSVNDVDTLEAAGVNLLQGYATREWLKNVEASEEKPERDMKVIAVLYDAAHTAGAENRLEQTKNTVIDFRRREGIFGWAVMDEPSPTPEILRELEDAYVTIRKYDKNHPVWITCNDNLETIAKYCDVLCADTYAYSGGYTNATVESITKAVAAAKGRPVYALLQAFDGNGTCPTAAQLRHTQYQALYAGAKGIGYYCFGSAVDGKNLDKTHLWTAVEKFGREKETAFRALVHSEGEIIMQGEDSDARWRVQRADGDIFVLLLNKTTTGSVTKTLEHAAFTADLRAFDAESVLSPKAVASDGKLTISAPASGVTFLRLVKNTDAVSFVKRNGESVEKVTSGEAVRPYIRIWNAAGKVPMTVLAEYEGNKLINCSMIQNTSTAEDTLFLEIGDEIYASEGKTYKLFLWNGNNLQPIQKATCKTE